MQKDALVLNEEPRRSGWLDAVAGVFRRLRMMLAAMSRAVKATVAAAVSAVTFLTGPQMMGNPPIDVQKIISSPNAVQQAQGQLKQQADYWLRYGKKLMRQFGLGK